jgi:hypothetical protein
MVVPACHAESIPGLPKSSKIRIKFGIKSAMSHKMLIFKAVIDFVLGSVLPPPENQFHDGIDSHKESILWNRCLGSLKVSKFGLVVPSQTALPNFFLRNALVPSF